MSDNNPAQEAETTNTNRASPGSPEEPVTHHTGAIAIDEEDEGYQQSETSSLLSSIQSDIKRGKVENGRVYANYGKHEYGLPIDDDELDRLDMNHTKYTTLMSDKIYMAPLAQDVQKVLDIGTGTGIWAIDFADQHPSASIIGTDIAGVQPQWVPPNCQFQVDDAEDEWTFARDSFDYIHLRDLYHAIRNWPRLVQQAYDHLKPGGWVEFAAVHSEPTSDDGTLDEQSAYIELVRLWEDIGKAIACEPESAKKFKTWFTEQGFENVEEFIFKVPISPWPKDPRLKKVGAFELMNVLGGARGFMARGWTSSLGMTLEELEMVIHRMRKELPTNKQHVWIPFYVVIGRKPQSATPGA